MSSKANKMAKDMAGQKVDTKVVPFKVNFKVDDSSVYTIVYVSGVPKELDPDDPTIKHAAEQQFVNFINSRVYLEMYEPEQDHKNDYPTFLNMSKAYKVIVTSVERIE
jgi:hypothetical protein